MRVTTGRSSSTAAFASSNVKSRSTGLSSPFVLGIYVWSRALTWLGAIFAFYWFEPNRNPRAGRWDSPLIHDLGSFTDVWARWDSVFFVRIAPHGYDHASAAFYPLYPGLVAVLGRVFFGHYVLAGIVISLAACLGAFALLYRIAGERLAGGRAHGAPSCTWLFFRRRCSCKPSTASRSTSCSCLPRSSRPSAAASASR